jgi:septum formation protein
MNAAFPLILASASPRRAELMRRASYQFRAVPSHADEIHSDQLTVREICQANAYRKARSVAKHHPDSVVIGADTLVCQSSRVFGKPFDYAEACQMLQQFQGKTHEVITGVCLVRLRDSRQQVFSVSTDVIFRPLDSAQIQHYLNLINPLDKAGAYAIQEHGDLIVDHISGSLTNVIGLPMERLGQELERWS